MQLIKRVIILAVVTSFASCSGRSDEKDGLEDSKTSIEQEPVIGLWKSGKERWSTMNFLEDGTVQLENSQGESSLENWKRVEGKVYKIRIKNEVIGEYDRIESSTNIPRPVDGRGWTVKLNAVQYDVWNDSKPESKRLPPVTVEGDRLQKDLGATSEYYRRIQ